MILSLLTEKAVKWYRAAAEQGYARAQLNLGVCYENGTGVEKDAKEALKWYYIAAEQWNAEAWYNLGRCYSNGIGVKRDRKNAKKWSRRAANHGYEPAMKILRDNLFFFRKK